MATIVEMKREPADFLRSAPCARDPYFIRANESFMRTNASFMSTNASLMRTNASFALASHLIDPEIHNHYHFCQHQLSSPESITGKMQVKKRADSPGKSGRARVLLSHYFLAVPLVDNPSLHHKADLTHHRNVIERISRDRH
jgi:hypothetical protein